MNDKRITQRRGFPGDIRVVVPLRIVDRSPESPPASPEFPSQPPSPSSPPPPPSSPPPSPSSSPSSPSAKPTPSNPSSTKNPPLKTTSLPPQSTPSPPQSTLPSQPASSPSTSSTAKPTPPPPTSSPLQPTPPPPIPPPSLKPKATPLPFTLTTVSTFFITVTATPRPTPITISSLPQTTPLRETPKQSGSEVSKRLVELGIAGSVLAIFLIILILFFFKCRRKYRSPKRNIQTTCSKEVEESPLFAPTAPTFPKSRPPSSFSTGNAIFLNQKSNELQEKQSWNRTKWPLSSETIPPIEPIPNNLPRQNSPSPIREYEKGIRPIREVNNNIKGEFVPTIQQFPVELPANEIGRIYLEHPEVTRMRERVGVWRDEVLNTPQEIIEVRGLVVDGEIGGRRKGEGWSFGDGRYIRSGDGRGNLREGSLSLVKLTGSDSGEEGEDVREKGEAEAEEGRDEGVDEAVAVAVANKGIEGGKEGSEIKNETSGGGDMKSRKDVSVSAIWGN